MVERRPGVFKFGTPENNRKEADMAAALRRRHAIVDLIITTPPTTAEGMAAVAEIVAVSLRIAHGDDASEPVGWERLLLALRPHRRHADDGTEIAARTGGAA